ncbi:hypothetical protein F4805DRAFT_419289 [Annulohypoxylon moriforme]|nr:hypothetical protein F4805DRAFT_419289 [Annulohypoxylon moriforme]
MYVSFRRHLRAVGQLTYLAAYLRWADGQMGKYVLETWQTLKREIHLYDKGAGSRLDFRPTPLRASSPRAEYANSLIPKVPTLLRTLPRQPGEDRILPRVHRR